MKYLPFLILIISCVSTASAQEESSLMKLVAQYQEVPTNITYLEVDGEELKLDIYRSGDHLGEPPWVDFGNNKKPTLVYIHGGGWAALDKSIVIFKFLPFLEKGWTVVNINYRLGVPMVPAIVDSRCALNWVYENSEKYGFDTERIVLSGASAGGHLSLITGMKNNEYFDSPCQIDRELKVAAIINWFGVTDLSDFKDYFDDSIISKTDLLDMIQFGSPITYVGQDTPPILTIHGTNDSTVPFGQAEILHKKLDVNNLPNEMHAIQNGKHGGFTVEELSISFEKIWTFLERHLNKT